eukprot:13411018-Alexandrium_andersonii.AAC.1
MQQVDVRHLVDATLGAHPNEKAIDQASNVLDQANIASALDHRGAHAHEIALTICACRPRKSCAAAWLDSRGPVSSARCCPSRPEEPARHRMWC